MVQHHKESTHSGKISTRCNQRNWVMSKNTARCDQKSFVCLAIFVCADFIKFLSWRSWFLAGNMFWNKSMIEGAARDLTLQANLLLRTKKQRRPHSKYSDRSWQFCVCANANHFLASHWTGMLSWTCSKCWNQTCCGTARLKSILCQSFAKVLFNLLCLYLFSLHCHWCIGCFKWNWQGLQRKYWVLRKNTVCLVHKQNAYYHAPNSVSTNTGCWWLSGRI